MDDELLFVKVNHQQTTDCQLSAIVFFIFLIVLLLKIINSSELAIPLVANNEHIEVAWRMLDVERNFTSPMSTESLNPR